MSTFTATSNVATGSAYTSTNPPYLVTATATESASSNISQNHAQDIANNTAQQVANTTANNDANIITQALNLSPSGVIGQFNSFNISFVSTVPINGNGEFVGLIKEIVEDELETPIKGIHISSNKIVYEPVTFQPIPNASHLSTLNGSAYNYGGAYGEIVVNGETFSSPTAKSIIDFNRLSTISIPRTINGGQYIYIKLK
jgi:hypothetical protein